MIRRYQHSPDQAYFERQQGRAERRTRSYTRVIDEGLTDEGLATGAIQFGLEAAATDWYLGATTQAARAHLTLAAAAADAAYRRTPRPWNPFTLEWALVASVLDGRWEQAGAIAALAEAPGRSRRIPTPTHGASPSCRCSPPSSSATTPAPRRTWRPCGRSSPPIGCPSTARPRCVS